MNQLPHVVSINLSTEPHHTSASHADFLSPFHLLLICLLIYLLLLVFLAAPGSFLDLSSPTRYRT